MFIEDPRIDELCGRVDAEKTAFPRNRRMAKKETSNNSKDASAIKNKSSTGTFKNVVSLVLEHFIVSYSNPISYNKGTSHEHPLAAHFCRPSKEIVQCIRQLTNDEYVFMDCFASQLRAAPSQYPH
ncbi:hypothetical protein DICVIV_00398 [Dictyocaulus viviparus]|uniref:Uncharacterized protein n=1 Tax=Dictyocaulus viviparus TaxID=29172 RepID=A0A0D8Y9N4_DICVI|nr:hypothetical protein DICVIV_00398 [Dictyocaulus viviparus]